MKTREKQWRKILFTLAHKAYTHIFNIKRCVSKRKEAQVEEKMGERELDRQTERERAKEGVERDKFEKKSK